MRGRRCTASGGAWGWSASTTSVGTDLVGGYANTTVTIPGGFWIASFAALILGIFIAVQPRRAALLGVLYAVCEGFCLGAISASFDAQTDGIVGAAILSTACVFLVALVLYLTRIIKPTQKLVAVQRQLPHHLDQLERSLAEGERADRRSGRWSRLTSLFRRRA
jgi:hypothetical protein